MTDRELLEAAARAAGMDVRWYQKDCLRVADKCNGFAGKWNPLTDDGDALRLAVKLKVEIRLGEHDVMTFQGFKKANAEYYGDDPYAATRRAIVRAAAAIGAGMIDDSTPVQA